MKNSKLYVLLIAVLCCSAIFLTGCGAIFGAILDGLESAVDEETVITESVQDVDGFISQERAPERVDDISPTPEYPDEHPEERSDDAVTPESPQNGESEVPERWKLLVYDMARELHESLIRATPERQEEYGDLWIDISSHGYRVCLYDAGFDVPNLIVTDATYALWTELSTLYSYNGGVFQEIITAQWIEPAYNIHTGERDMFSATSHSGGTASHTEFYRFVGGRWQKESFWYATGGGQFFGDDATGEYGEFDEAQRLIEDRLKDYMDYDLQHTINLRAIDDNGNPILWERVSAEFRTFLDDWR